MNNNNFALLRYFRDLGADADLLLMADDGIGPLAHFSPDNDTWTPRRWEANIRQLQAPNRFISAIGNDFPWKLLFWTKFAVAKARGSAHSKLTRPPSLVRLAQDLRPYDRLVGSGITPALLELIQRRLDVFYPYSSGVEWVADPDVTAVMQNGNWLWRLGALRVRAKQIAGIRAAKQVLSSDVGYTAEIFAKMGLSPRLLQLPMLYKEPAPASYPSELAIVLQKLAAFEMRFISHARHRWVNTGDFDEATWELKYSKHNNWVIAAFSEFRRQHPDTRSVLVLVEYGTDVSHSKRLCQEQGLTNDVLWLPRMPRMHLLEIISACDVGISEFYSMPRMMWGGTALEIMACGKPLIQGFVFDDGEYQAIYGTPPPPLCAVRTQDDLTRWLLHLGESPSLRQQLGSDGLLWFDTYNGHGLARQWLNLIAAPN